MDILILPELDLEIYYKEININFVDRIRTDMTHGGMRS
jgi:hypothetical protein